MLIFAYADEALQKTNGVDFPLYISFNCTHYGYSLDCWRKVFMSLGTEPKDFLNPNSRMIDFLFPPALQDRTKNTQVTAHVVSMVDIKDETISSLGAWLAAVSPQTAEALREYEKRENLFEWTKFVTNKRQPRL
jgi:hypothetical protein